MFHGFNIKIIYIFPLVFVLIASLSNLSFSIFCFTNDIEAVYTNVIEVESRISKKDDNIELPLLSSDFHHCKGSNDSIVTHPKCPNFIIAGAQKCGTSALWGLCNKHPEIISKRAEVHFFDNLFPATHMYRPDLRGKLSTLLTAEQLCDLHHTYTKSVLQYQNLSEIIHRIHFDRTPSYLLCSHIPEFITLTCPSKPKIIISLRNPVDRAYSAYYMQRRRSVSGFADSIQKDFEELIRNKIILEGGYPNPKWLQHKMTINFNKLRRNVLFRGFYAQQLQHWLDHFPLGESLIVIRYEVFKEKKNEIMNEIFDFVGASKFNFTKDELNKDYIEATPTNEKDRMTNETRIFLEKLYEPHNQMLADMLGEGWRNIWY